MTNKEALVCSSDLSSVAVKDSDSDSSTPDSTSLGPASPTRPAEPSSESSTPASRLHRTCETSTLALREWMSLLADFLASPFPSPGSNSPRQTSDGFGLSSSDAFAYYDQEASSWRTCQGSLLEDSQMSSPDWPARAMWDRSFAYELPTLELLIGVSAFSSLLPTPSATQNDGHNPEKFLERREREKEKGQNGNGFGLTLGMSVQLLPTPGATESDPGEEMLEEIRDGFDPEDPNHRLYLPDRKWMTQRTLRRTAAALLPTPGANDSTGAEKETRDARRESGDTGGPSLRDLPKLLPTPTGQDSANNGGPSQYERNTPPLNAEMAKLLPTPTSAVDSGSRNLPGSKAHAGVSLTDAVKFGNSTTPRTLPTPQASDGSGGRLGKDPETLRTGRRPSGSKASKPLRTALYEESIGEPTSLPSDDGSSCSEDPLPDQLTIEDA
jgi:hypothetical protein